MTSFGITRTKLVEARISTELVENMQTLAGLIRVGTGLIMVAKTWGCYVGTTISFLLRRTKCASDLRLN